MIARLLGLLNLKMLPWLLAALGAATAAFYAYGKAQYAEGRIDGVTACELAHGQAERLVIEELVERNERVTKRDLDFITVDLRRKENIRVVIKEIPVPHDLCEPDRLRDFLNQGVRGARTTGYSWPIDPASAFSERG